MLTPSNVRSAEPVTEHGLACPVVGIGASAGGIAALSRFFEKIDEPTGMAFVVIMHLSPHHESNVAAILQRVTTLTIMQVVERTRIVADHVYVIPPGKDLDIDDGHLSLKEPTRESGPHVAVDLFLRTLAEVQGDRAFAIILSGLGSDGALGVRRINECGGVAIAQQPDEAEFDSMPRAAIATGLVDLVLPVDEMPGRLRSLWANILRMRVPRETDGSPLSSGQDEGITAESALRQTLDLLHKRTRHDFRHYKRATVLRRLERRLQVNAVPDLAAYREYLDRHPAETGALLQDMLISVTSFFRDPESFAALETIVIPALFERRAASDTVRVWIAACATGEEAYSIAILLHEHLETLADPPRVQVFATDIDERAIALGRAGLYPEGIANDVSSDRLRRFFRKEGDRYRIVKTIRESVLFAVHNLLRDPPFSRLDLVSCRNFLIYLDGDAQKSVIDTARFALRAGGHLFLGASESADAGGDAFQTRDKKHRIFEAAGDTSASRPASAIATQSGTSPVSVLAAADGVRSSNADRHRRALDRYGAASVLVDARHQILHMTHAAGPYFIRAGGTPSHDLIANTRTELRPEMRMALFRVREANDLVATSASWTEADGRHRRVAIEIQPFRDDDAGADFRLVTLRELDDVPGTLAAAVPGANDRTQSQLEREVGEARRELQDTIERSETSNEELTASNEELQAINEELRSATEELETSREELQSINEELTTVNSELKAKVDETNRINDDLQNLISSTDIAVVFVDAQMRIKRFTPRAKEVFNLIPGDIGRSLLDITHRLKDTDITADAEDAFNHLRIIEREAVSQDGRHYLSRVIPYRTLHDKIEGAVLTFVDITSRVTAERKVGENEERLRIAAETVRHYVIITLDEHGVIRTWNAGARDAFGYDESEVIGRSFDMLFTPEDRENRVPAQEMATARATGSAEDERWHLHKDGSRFYCSGVTTSYRTDGVEGFAKIARDMTGTKLLEARRDEEFSRQKQMNLAAEAANRLKDEFLAVMSHELKHPLNLIHVNAELLSRLPEVSQFPSVRRAAETIRRSVAGQARIIDDLLDLSRARTGKMMMTLERTSMRDIVARIAEAAVGDASAKRVRLERVIPADDALTVLADPMRVEQIVWNLLSNAVKFTDADGLVTLRIERRGAEIVLDVGDTGRGIAPAFIDDVFSMFRQERRETKNGEGGMGIGLALVKELTEAQGGRVAVASPGVGRGATFTVALPAADAPTQPGALAALADDGPLRGLRVLLIDDSVESVEPFAELLRLEGAEVVEGHSGAEALQWLDRQTFDLLISDVGMPKMDGYQLIDAIRQRNGVDDLVAIAMSGYGRPSDVQRATEVGFDAHLTKPASIDDCKALIAQLRTRGRL